MGFSLKKIPPDIWWSLSVLAVVFLFLLPILVGVHGIFLDDERQHNYPNQVFQARCLKQGIIPLWDPHTFAGGLVFYTRVEDYAFYPVQWLFGLLGRVDPSFASFRDLVIFPIIGHFLWAALGAFVLGRWGLGLSRVGSAALSLAFTLSTSMIVQVLNHPMTIALSWHPWLAAAVLVYYRKRSPGWLVFGAFIIAFSGPPFPNYALFGYFITLTIAVVVVTSSLVREGIRNALSLGAGLAAMGVIGLFLAAPFWLAIVDGARSVWTTFRVDYDFLTSGPRSVPWRWLATIFVPELFGTINYDFIWGAAEDHQMYLCEGMISRGMLFWFPAVLAVWAALKAALRYLRKLVPPGRERMYQTEGKRLIGDYGNIILWTWVGLGIIIFASLMMAGRFSPVYGFLYRLGPLFHIPYASRWHTVFTMGLAILTGIGVHRLWNPASSADTVTRRQVIGYMILVLLTISVAVTIPLGYWRKLTDFNWFLKVPSLYWLVSTCFLILLCIFWNPRWAGRIIVVLALAGLFRSAAWDAFQPMGITWAPEQDYARRPEETELYRFIDYASRYDTDPLRRTGYSRVFCDNGALIYGGHSLLGVGVKPMLPRMYHTLAQICEGMPNETVLEDPTLPFVKNMSAGFWWYDNPRPPSPEWEYVDAYPGGGLFLFKIPDALPRVYTLNRLQPAPEEKSRRDLIYRDLREIVLVDESDEQAAGYASGRTGMVTDEDPIDHFRFLQKENRIRRFDSSNPHLVEVDIDVMIPAMLVVTDAWHPGWKATDNNRPVLLHRVNHFQRGVWLGKGEHHIRMSFQPSSVRNGRWFSLIGLLLCGMLLWYGRKKTGSDRMFQRTGKMF